jgi:hypothetical protein
LAVEGKEYTVEDGDVMHFRFNVWYFLTSQLAIRLIFSTLAFRKFDFLGGFIVQPIFLALSLWEQESFFR